MTLPTDEVPLFVEDTNPDPTLHEEAVGGSEESSDVETYNKETSCSDSECEATKSYTEVEAEDVGAEEEECEEEGEGKRKIRGIVKRNRRKDLKVDKGKGVLKGRGVPCLRVSRSRLARKSRRVTMQQKIRSLIT